MLINQIMDNEASQSYIENMPEPRMAYITNRRLLWKCFWNGSKRTSFNGTAEDLAETKFKNKRSTSGEETGVGKTKLAMGGKKTEKNQWTNIQTKKS